MKKLSVVIVIVGILVGYSFNASAQFIPKVKEVTAFGGGTFNGTSEATAGGAFAVNVTPRLGVEVEAGAIFADNTKFNGSGNLVFNLGTGQSAIVPYLIGGGGVLANGGTDIALNIGGGLKMFVEPTWAIRADFRVFLITEDGDVENLQRLYGGLTFFF